MFWISHVPATIFRVNELINSNLEFITCSDERYSYSEHQETYADIGQKWVVIHTTLMHTREEKTFDDNLKKDFKKDSTTLRKLCSIEFACEPDARAAAEKWIQTHSRYRFKDFEIVPVTRKTDKRRGRPKIGDPVLVSFSISADLEYDDKTIDRERYWANLFSQQMILNTPPILCSRITRGRDR
jgi:transposase